jgi:hypothetical protein
MLHRVALVRTDVSEESNPTIIRVTRISGLETALALTGNRLTLRRKYMVFPRSVPRLLVIANVVPSSPIVVNLMMEALLLFETSVVIRVTRRNIAEYDILHGLRRENLKPYTINT